MKLQSELAKVYAKEQSILKKYEKDKKLFLACFNLTEAQNKNKDLLA